MRLMPLGFRGRLIAAAAFLSLVTLGVAFALVSALVNGSQQRQLDEALGRVAVEEATELAAPGQQLRISDRPGPAANDVGPLPKLGVIYDAGGNVVSATENVRGQQPPLASLPSRDGEFFDLSFGGEHLRGVIFAVGAHPGVRLLIAAPRADLDGDAAFLTRAMLAVFALAVAWTVAMAVGIVGRLTRHHRVIVNTAKRVAAGDLSARVGSLPARGEVAELGHNIDEMIERLALLLRGQQQFIAHAAHELRSPLATLYGELSHALRKSRGADEYRAAIEEALDSTRRLKMLAEDLLGLARLGAERGAAGAETVDLGEVLEDSVAAVAPEAGAKNVRVEVACPLGVTIAGRRGDLARMFRNLLENGVRHAPSSSVVPVLVVRQPAGINVEVSDLGGGVAENERERVFEPFFRGASVRAANYPGAGLGLTIARDIARLHGGDIQLADSFGGPGARFVVTLPGMAGLSSKPVRDNDSPSTP